MARWPGGRFFPHATNADVGARFQSAQPIFDETTLAHYNNIGTVTLEGLVWDEPDERDTRTNLRVQVETLTVLGEAPRAVWRWFMRLHFLPHGWQKPVSHVGVTVTACASLAI